MITWIKNLSNQIGGFHLSGNAVKVVSILGGLAFGILSHNWNAAAGIAIGGNAVSLGTSIMGIRASNNIVANGATAQIPKP